MLSYTRLIRPLICTVAALSVWIGALLAGSPQVPGKEVIMGMAAMFLIWLSGAILTGRSEQKEVKGGIYAAVILLISGNLIAAYLGRYPFYITAFASILLVAYSLYLKKIIFAGHIAISFLLAANFFFGALILDNIFAPFWAALLVFVANMGREVYKSIDEVMNDKNHGTPALGLGVFKTKAIGSAFMLGAVLISFVPFVLGIMNELYMFFAIIGDLCFVTAAGAPVKYSSKFSKIGLIIIYLALIMGTMQVRALL